VKQSTDAAAVVRFLQAEHARLLFSSKVDLDGPIPRLFPELGRCHVWTAACDRNGYGNFSVYVPELKRTKNLLAHRASWTMQNGSAPDGLLLHFCDNRPCVNVAHVRIGSSKENTADMESRGRRGRGYRRRLRIGSAHHKAKLHEGLVPTIRVRVAAGESMCSLAREFGVTPAAIRQLFLRRTWRHVA